MVVNQEVLTVDRVTHARTGLRIKTIALPAEHGGWGLLFEPIALGLLLAPSVAGLYLALSFVGFFLARQPLTLLMLNRRRSSPRTALARRFLAVYVGIATASFLAAFIFSHHAFILPLVIAAPLAFVQLAHDSAGRRRVLVSEVAGVIAISSLATAIALAGGWSYPAAFALWAIMIARSVPAILYVRACLARLHSRSASPLLMLIAHVLAVLIVGLLIRAQLAPRLVLAVMIILIARAGIGFARLQRATAKQIGFSEIGFGILTVLGVVLGRAFGL